MYLRARFYNPSIGGFQTKDTWKGFYSRPQSLNRWSYVLGNPNNFTDPTGYIAQGTEDQEAIAITNRLKSIGIMIVVDWGDKVVYHSTGSHHSSIAYYQGVTKCGWTDGVWDIGDLRLIEEAANKLNGMLSGKKILSAIGQAKVYKYRGYWGGMAPPGILSHLLSADILLQDSLNVDPDQYKNLFVHEFGHVWDYRTGNKLSKQLMKALNTWVCKPIIDRDTGQNYGDKCYWDPYYPTTTTSFDPSTYTVKTITTYPEPPPDTLIGCELLPPALNSNTASNGASCKDIPYSSTYGNGGRLFTGPGAEDWANSLAYYVYDISILKNTIGLRPIRRKYVETQINGLP